MYSGMGFISTVDRIPILSEIPTVPFECDDGVILKSEAELKAMDLSSLILFGSTLSTSVGLQTSTLLQNLKIQGLYGFLKGRSQSTIDGLNNEITTNNGLISMYTGLQNNMMEGLTVWEYDDINWTEVGLLQAQRGGGAQGGGGKSIFISTLDQFDATIGNQMDYIKTINSTISSYSVQYTSSISSIAEEMSSFTSAAKAYSTSIWTTIGYQKLLGIKQENYDTTTEKLRAATTAEQASSTLVAKKKIHWHNMSDKLSTLYDIRASIAARLITYRKNEADTYIQYQSSLAGLSTTSSLYDAAGINEKYALAFAELTQRINAYSDAEVQFNNADALYATSGGSALLAARSMAKTQLEAASTAKLTSQATASNLLSLATLANTRAYESILQGYDIRIDAYNRTRLQYKGYKETANSNVARFSSMYEIAVTDIKNYTGDIKRYSTLYESSIDAASTLLGLSKDELLTMEQQYQDYQALGLSIADLETQYTGWREKYARDIAASTMHASQYYSSLSSIETYNTMYGKASDMVSRLYNEIYGPGGLMSKYYTMRFTMSSIINSDIIDQKVYDTKLKYLINEQDHAIYEYRETFCRDQEVSYQTDYTNKIYDAVQFAQSNSLPSANIDTPEILQAGKILNDMNTFIGTFSNIYKMYDTQTSNIQNISTSVGNETTAWSTVDCYTWGQYFQTMSNQDLPSLINSSVKYLTLHQSTTAGLLTSFQSQQDSINVSKETILSGLKPFFTDNEISAQSDTISSFIIISSNDAIAMALAESFVM